MSSSSPPSPPDQERLEKATTWLLGGFGTLTTIFGALGVAGDGVERMLRNSPDWSIAAFAAIGFAFLIAGGSYLAVGLGLRRLLLAVGSVAFAFGLITAIRFAAAVPSTREQPAIVAKFSTSDRLVFEATVTASGLGSEESLRVAVDGVKEVNARLRPARRLFTGELGPDPAGKVNLPISIPLQPDDYDYVFIAAGTGNLRRKCSEEDSNQKVGSRPKPFEVKDGCVIIDVPDVQPQ